MDIVDEIQLLSEWDRLIIHIEAKRVMGRCVSHGGDREVEIKSGSYRARQRARLRYRDGVLRTITYRFDPYREPDVAAGERDPRVARVVKTHWTPPQPRPAPAETPHRWGVVYFIQRLDGLVKIGHTSNLQQRLRRLDPEGVGGLKVIHSFTSDKARDRELELHGKYQACRVDGELFRLTEEQIKECLWLS